ncbi:hypothetical protein C8Q74DRAFT_1306769 [Fomes fomentarius]|nr:hypothetical protein C8Q74DRAFT_1306769 [Fomes fomentarius]
MCICGYHHAPHIRYVQHCKACTSSLACVSSLFPRFEPPLQGRCSMSSPGFRFTSIPDIIQCVTANITWTGGTPPYAIQINPPEESGGEVSPMVRAILPEGHLVERMAFIPQDGIVPNLYTTAYFLWTPVFPGGTQGNITVFDHQMQNISASYVVSSNSSPSCVDRPLSTSQLGAESPGPEGPSSGQSTSKSSTTSPLSYTPTFTSASGPPQQTSSESSGLYSSTSSSVSHLATETAPLKHQSTHSAMIGGITAAITLATVVPLITLGVIILRCILGHRRRKGSDIVSPWLSPPRSDRDSHAPLSVKRGLIMTQSGISTLHHSPEMSGETYDSISTPGEFSNDPSMDSLRTLPANEYSLPIMHTDVQDAGSRVVGLRLPSIITQPQVCYGVGEARPMHSLYMPCWQMARGRTRRVEIDGGVSLAGGALRDVDQMSDSIGSTLPPPYPQH